MKVRRISPLLVTIPVLAGLLAPSLAMASTTTDPTYAPMARAPKDDAAAEDEKDKKKQPEPCPQDMWSVPLEVEGLACVLLLPKDSGGKKDEKGKGGKGGEDSGS